jgi:hypothetical protein
MSFEAERNTGSMAQAGSALTAANFKRTLLLLMPQSPNVATEQVRPVERPCWRARRNPSIWALRPMNSSGLTGKLGLGSMLFLHRNESHRSQIDVCDFCDFWTDDS